MFMSSIDPIHQLIRCLTFSEKLRETFRFYNIFMNFAFRHIHWVFTALTAAHLLQPRHLLQHWPWTDFLEFKRFVTKIISTN